MAFTAKSAASIERDLQSEMDFISRDLTEELKALDRIKKLGDEVGEFISLRQEEKDIKDENDTYAKNQGWKWDDNRGAYVGMTKDGKEFQVSSGTVQNLQSLDLLAGIYDVNPDSLFFTKDGEVKPGYKLKELNAKQLRSIEKRKIKAKRKRDRIVYKGIRRSEKKKEVESRRLEKSVDKKAKAVLKAVKKVDSIYSSTISKTQGSKANFKDVMAELDKFSQVLASGKGPKEAHTETAIIKGRKSLVTPSEKALIDKYGQDAANYIHDVTMKLRGSIEIDKKTGMPKYGFFAGLWSGLTGALKTGFGALKTGIGNIGSGAAGGAGTGLFGKAGGFMSQFGTDSGALSKFGTGPGGAIFGAVSMVAGAAKKAKAYRKQYKELGKQIKTARKERSKLGTQAYEQMEELEDRSERQGLVIQEDTSEALEDLTDQIGQAEKASRGLKTGAADYIRREGKEAVSQQYEQAISSLDDAYEDSMDDLIGQVKGGMDQYQSSIKKMIKQRKYAKRHNKWYKNIF